MPYLTLVPVLQLFCTCHHTLFPFLPPYTGSGYLVQFPTAVPVLCITHFGLLVYSTRVCFGSSCVGSLPLVRFLPPLRSLVALPLPPLPRILPSRSWFPSSSSSLFTHIFGWITFITFFIVTLHLYCCCYLFIYWFLQFFPTVLPSWFQFNISCSCCRLLLPFCVPSHICWFWLIITVPQFHLLLHVLPQFCSYCGYFQFPSPYYYVLSCVILRAYPFYRSFTVRYVTLPNLYRRIYHCYLYLYPGSPFVRFILPRLPHAHVYLPTFIPYL